MSLPALLVASSSTVPAPGRPAVYALRHGQSEANVQGIISSDPEVATVTHGLTPSGREAAAAAAAAVVARAKELGCGVAICSSDFLRARETATIVHEAVAAANVPVWPSAGVSLRSELRERRFGGFGSVLLQVEEGNVAARRLYEKVGYAEVWREDALDATHERYGVESVASVLSRSVGLVRALATEPALRGAPWMLLLVAHGDVLQITQTHFARAEPSAHRSLEHLPTATLRELGSLPPPTDG